MNKASCAVSSGYKMMNFMGTRNESAMELVVESVGGGEK